MDQNLSSVYIWNHLDLKGPILDCACFAYSYGCNFGMHRFSVFSKKVNESASKFVFMEVVNLWAEGQPMKIMIPQYFVSVLAMGKICK